MNSFQYLVFDKHRGLAAGFTSPELAIQFACADWDSDRRARAARMLQSSGRFENAPWLVVRPSGVPSPEGDDPIAHLLKTHNADGDYVGEQEVDADDRPGEDEE